MEAQNSGISSTLRKNILGSTLFKGLDVLFNFLLVRYAILFFGDEHYGIWLTVLSVFTWFSVLEFGISSSFRNKMTRLFADDKKEALRHWIGKGYKAAIRIYVAVIVLVTLLYIFTGFSLEQYEKGFSVTVLVCFVLYMIHYIFFFLQTVLLGTHHAAETYLLNAVQKGVLLVGIIGFIQFDFSPSLQFICLWFSIVPLVVWALANGVLFQTKLKEINPGIRYVVREKTKPLKHLRGPFFIIQVCTLAIYSTDHLMIMYYSNGTDVTAYGVTFKYFNSLIIVFNIVLLPYWSSFAEAVHAKNIGWIKKQVKRLIMLWLAILGGGFGMLILSDYVYTLWIGKDMEISFWLSAFMLLFVLLTCWNNIFAYFLNSIDQTKRQMNILLISAVINIPLTIYLLNTYGLPGAVGASCLVLFPLSIALPLQYRKQIKSLEL